MLWPTEDLTPERQTVLFQYLTSLKEGIDLSTIIQQQNELFQELLVAYNLSIFNENTKKAIGEPSKPKRICRFCKKGMPDVFFKHIAHAISESLGNKKIILYEECDSCNAFFGSADGIEGSLITYLSIYSNFFGVKGKSGIPKLKGKNFEMTNVSTIELIHHLKEGEEPTDQSGGRMDFKLETFKEIVDQDIY